MCTAISINSGDHYFGRTLDLEYHYDEQVVITPRKFSFSFTNNEQPDVHRAIIGIATVIDNYPLYYDAMNESGLAVAGLNFPGNAVFHPVDTAKINVAPFEFIPYILTHCNNVNEAEKLLRNINIANIDFRPDLKASPLHWIISDKERSITVESVKDGLKIYNNPVGVLTNNPPFDFHLKNLYDYAHLSATEPENVNPFSDGVCTFSKGMGAVGLPGDFSSESRFIRANFIKSNSVTGNSEEENVRQFFHIMGTVDTPRGSIDLGDRKYEITIYTTCYNADKGICYFTTYENPQICAVNLHNENLDTENLIRYQLKVDADINYIN
jgi:choloylglycine hydrolase